MLGGRKVAVSRPRVRGVAGGELALPIWEAFAGEELLGDQTMASLLAGVSTRNYDKALEPSEPWTPRRPPAPRSPVASSPAPPRPWTS